MIILKPTTENTYLNHARQHQMINRNKTLRESMDLPICPKCQRIGLRHKGWKEKKIMVCPKCGYEGHTPITLSNYLQQGLYK